MPSLHVFGDTDEVIQKGKREAEMYFEMTGVFLIFQK
jgi:hypothetical protein